MTETVSGPDLQQGIDVSAIGWFRPKVGGQMQAWRIATGDAQQVSRYLLAAILTANFHGPHGCPSQNISDGGLTVNLNAMIRTSLDQRP